MFEEPLEYGDYFQVDQHVSIGIHLPDSNYLNDRAVVKSIEGSRVLLELFGDGLPHGVVTEPGAQVVLAGKAPWTLYRCSALLEAEVEGKSLVLQLTGSINIQQRRDHVRFDVTLPITYTVPVEQTIAELEASWYNPRHSLEALSMSPDMYRHEQSFKVVNWAGLSEILPLTVNISGGGIRFKLPELLEEGTLVCLELFLPVVPARAIPVVAEVLRANEIRLNWDRHDYFSTAMRFLRISERDRETIISVIFAEQRRCLWAMKEFGDDNG